MPPSRPSTVQTGARAEELALRYLESQGLRLVERNFRCRAGEIDLVMLDVRELVIVEVRYRASAALVDPALTVSPPKRRRILRAAAGYLQRRRQFADCAVRLDVIALTGPLEEGRCACRWYRAAFGTDDAGRF
jgi:putative endonuclease